MQKAAWVFTLNNPESNDVPRGWAGVRYCIWQRERAESGTEHLQGYVVVTKCTLAGMKKRCGQAHWEERRGSHDQAKAYSSKEDTRIAGPWVIGNEPNPGQRNDLLALKEAVDSGVSLAVCAEEHFTVMAKHSRWIREYIGLKKLRQRHWLTYTTVYWGPPGTGKTTRVIAEASKSVYWLKKPANNQALFFDGYDGEEDVMIDEFYSWIPLETMCRLMDYNPMMVDTKGGMVEFAAKRIWITSNVSPALWYKNMPAERVAALHRRLIDPMGKVEYMGVPLDGPWKGEESAARARAVLRGSWPGVQAVPEDQFILPPVVGDKRPIDLTEVSATQGGYDSDMC